MNFIRKKKTENKWNELEQLKQKNQSIVTIDEVYASFAATIQAEEAIQKSI